MNTEAKMKEITEFRGKNKYITKDTVDKLNRDEKLIQDVVYRQKLYDWVMDGYSGLKPLKKG